MQIVNGLPAPPPVPQSLLLCLPTLDGRPTLGHWMVDGEAPVYVGAPACPVCHAAVHYSLHYGRVGKAICSRSMAATRMEPPTRPHGVYCRWTGWITQNQSTGLIFVVAHGDTEPTDEEVEPYVVWTPA